MSELWNSIVKLWQESGLARLCNFENGGWKNLIMIGIACVLIYLAVKKGFEPLLLLPIAFGMLLVNLPLSGHHGSPDEFAGAYDRGGIGPSQSRHIHTKLSVYRSSAGRDRTNPQRILAAF